ncbi:MAG TPA: hypothetical protein VIU11_01765 [Nakamurella sp.]
MFGSDAMLSVGNQLPTSDRRSDATATEVAPPYFNFFPRPLHPGLPGRAGPPDRLRGERRRPSSGFVDGRAARILADAVNESLRTGAVVAVTA